jgi:hypothetical protein
MGLDIILPDKIVLGSILFFPDKFVFMEFFINSPFE